MSLPQVVAVSPASPAALAGILPGDVVQRLNGVVPRDVIEYQLITDEPSIEIELLRDSLPLEVTIEKEAGRPLGMEVSSAVFDRIRTCDNHCEFCFIYQLPKKMRKSLYIKDDDYRLSFLYGNFTTLTRFTELDLERVVTERLSPLYVSIHATDPDLRARLLRNRRGATSLRWLRALLDHGITVHGQIVVCPGINDGLALADTLAGVLERYPELASVGVVPLGVSRHSNEAAMRPHTNGEASLAVDIVEGYREVFRRALGHPMVYASDEYYLISGRPLPAADEYGEFVQHENGIGMARLFEETFFGRSSSTEASRGGFFQSVDGAPAEGYRAPKLLASTTSEVTLRTRRDVPTTILTGSYGQQVIEPVLRKAGLDSVELLTVENRFFGGNIAVAGLLTGEDLVRALQNADPARRYLLPDVALSEGRFLDGLTPSDLPRPVEIVEATGQALAKSLGFRPKRRLPAVAFG